ncbi:MAG: DUF6510 family protein [Chloroflexi bacterium]|nr:DUF6510 family protein [Chloroflexota bacterium]
MSDPGARDLAADLDADAQGDAAGPLDGNVAAGALAAALGADMTEVPARCAHCATVTVVAELRAWVGGPGIVLRCPTCSGVVIRIAEIGAATLVDARGAAMLRIEHR